MSRTGRYNIYPIAGLAAAALSFLMLTAVAATIRGGIGLVEISLIILDCGFGLVMPNLVVALQNGRQLTRAGGSHGDGRLLPFPRRHGSVRLRPEPS